MEKLLPQNIEAECGVLGSIIIDPMALPSVSDFLYAEDFYRDAHRTIFEVILHLDRERVSPDFITICDELERREKLDDVGGASYITSLINQVPTSGNIEYYGRIVERTSILRKLIHAAGQVAAIAYEQAEDAPQKAEEIIYHVTQGRKQRTVISLADVLADYQEKLAQVYEQRQRGVVFGVPTGFSKFDRMTGGFQKSDLVILAARPSVGKTSWMLNTAQVAAQQYGHTVLIFSLEMSREQLGQRLLASDAQVDQARLRGGFIEDEEWEGIVLSIARLSLGHIWIDDTAGISLVDMRSRARRVQSEHGLDLIIADYAQLMTTGNTERKYENRVQEVSAVSRGLKALARDLSVPVLALAQLSRAVEAREDKVPQLSDLKESGSFEQDADVVAFLHCLQDQTNLDARMQSNPHLIDLIVAKQRNGPVGVVPLQFTPKLTRFRSVIEGRPQ